MFLFCGKYQIAVGENIQEVSYSMGAMLYRDVASYSDLPARTQTFMRSYFLSHRKAGRSGQFGDVMVMSPGRGSEECMECGRYCAF